MKNNLLFNLAATLFCLGVCFAISTNAQANNCEDNSTDKSVNRPLPDKIFGVTVENADDEAIRDAAFEVLKKLCVNNRKPFVRIVFQDKRNPDKYKKAVEEFHKVAFIVGEILDSQAVKEYSVTEYTQRTRDFWKKFGNLVDVWEVGNEINGEWLRLTSKEALDAMKEPERTRLFEKERKDVVAKVQGAFDIINDKNGTTRYKGRTALTLYFNDDGSQIKSNGDYSRENGSKHCWAFEQDEMFSWAKTQVPPEMKQKLDFVWISYYDDPSCIDGCRQETENGEKQLKPDWKNVFVSLERLFTNAKTQLGFGEIGTRLSKDKIQYIKRHYDGSVARIINNSRFSGGYFWWYFEDDMLPDTGAAGEAYLKTLIESIRQNN